MFVAVEPAMRLLLAAASLALAGVHAAGPTHGVVVGDVTNSRATVWSRSDEASIMQASVYECGAPVGGEEFTGEVQVDSTGDFTGLVDFSGLADETCYEVEVVFNPSFAASATSTSNPTSTSTSASSSATFTTAPNPGVTRAVKFAWGGDISGQNVCRDATEGFPLMDVINGAGPYDFFLNVGDAIYGDGVCHSPGLGGNAQVEGDFKRASDLDNFWAHWKYNLEDPGYQTLLSSQAFFMTWDDHEVVDDFGPGFDERESAPYTAGESLLPIGLQAFLNYNPIRATTDPSQPLDFYRSVRWGNSMELFILDTRQYRSLPTDRDTKANPKTMLGETQLAWLKESLTNSTALWKMVVTSVPLSIPTGPGDTERDGWANFEGNTGYERELEDILTHMKDGGMHNVVFLTADVHFAQVLEYTPFASDPDFNFHEIVVGPLNAGPFKETDLDDTFSPTTLFFYSPESNTLNGEISYEVFRPFFNFGLAEIDLEGNLTISIINTDGETVYSTTLASGVDVVVPGGTPTPSPASTTPGPSVGRNDTAAPPASVATAPAASVPSVPTGVTAAPAHVTSAPARATTGPTHATTAPTRATTGSTRPTSAPTTDVTGAPTTDVTGAPGAATTSSPEATPAPSAAAATRTVDETSSPAGTISPSVAPDGDSPGADGSDTDGSAAGAGARPPQGVHRLVCGFLLVGVVGLSSLIGGRW